MSLPDELNELRHAIRSLQGGLLTALDSLTILMQQSPHQTDHREQIAELKRTVQSLQGLEPKETPKR